MTDADLLNGGAGAQSGWLFHLSQAKHSAHRGRPAPADGTAPGHPGRHLAAHGILWRGRLAVGDAAAAYDPLSS